jgi:thiol-disulfide isomerase/thioredoxin
MDHPRSSESFYLLVNRDACYAGWVASIRERGDKTRTLAALNLAGDRKYARRKAGSGGIHEIAARKSVESKSAAQRLFAALLMPIAFKFDASSIAIAFWILLCAGMVLPSAGQKNSAEDLNGKSIDPFAIHGNQAVVLLFVRTDCPISNRYAPTIQKLNKKFQGKVKFWLVYPDADETVVGIRSHIAQYHYELPALRDVHHVLVKRADATILPESAVFDPGGNLKYHGRIDNWYEDFGRARPAPTSHELEDAIRATLEGRTVAPDHVGAVGCYIADSR